MNSDNRTKSGTIGGTLLTVFYHISVDDFAKTIVLAAVGAIVSYTVSTVLKRVFERRKK